ncbi:MAG: hypothetical protein RIE58_01295 [Vicingaceae bacterium]
MSFIGKIVTGITRIWRPKTKENESSSTVSTPIANEAQYSKTPGLNCPQCSFRISVSVPMLLSGAAIVCPACNLKLNVEQEQSKPCLDELKKVNDAMNRAEAVKQNVQ